MIIMIEPEPDYLLQVTNFMTNDLPEISAQVLFRAS